MAKIVEDARKLSFFIFYSFFIEVQNQRKIDVLLMEGIYDLLFTNTLDQG